MTTRQDMLDAINMKIARTYEKEGCQAFSDACGKKDEEGKFICQYCRRWGGQQRGKFEPVMIGDIFAYIDQHCFYYQVEDGHYSRDMEELKECIVALFYMFIGKFQLSLNEQEDETVEYIYNLLPYDNK